MQLILIESNFHKSCCERNPTTKLPVDPRPSCNAAQHHCAYSHPPSSLSVEKGPAMPPQTRSAKKAARSPDDAGTVRIVRSSSDNADHPGGKLLKSGSEYFCIHFSGCGESSGRGPSHCVGWEHRGVLRISSPARTEFRILTRWRQASCSRTTLVRWRHSGTSV